MLTRRTLLKAGMTAMLAPGLPGAVARSAATPATSFEDWREEFEAGLAQRMARFHVPGAAVAIIDRDTPTPYANAFGYADVARQRPLTAQTPMHLASVSKLFTASSLVQLFGHRGLDLHSDVNRLIDFRVRNPYHPEVPITPFQLLTHTSSISDNGYVGFTTNGDSPLSLSSFLRNYLVPRGRFYRESNSFIRARPGAVFDYSDVGMALAGYVVQCVSGERFSAYTERHLFAALQITDAHWYLDQFAPGVLARPYHYARGRFIAYPQEGYPDVPAGMLRCSVANLATAVRAMIGGHIGSPAILSPAQCADMLRDHVTPSVVSYQGLGWVEEGVDGRAYVGHSGSDRGAANYVILDRDHRRGVALLTNIDWTDAAQPFRASVVDDLLRGAALL